MNDDSYRQRWWKKDLCGKNVFQNCRKAKIQAITLDKDNAFSQVLKVIFDRLHIDYKINANKLDVFNAILRNQNTKRYAMFVQIIALLNSSQSSQ